MDRSMYEEMPDVSLSGETYVCLLEKSLKLDAVTRYFENDSYGAMSRAVFCDLTGFDIPEGGKKDEIHVI